MCGSHVRTKGDREGRPYKDDEDEPPGVDHRSVEGDREGRPYKDYGDGPPGVDHRSFEGDRHVDRTKDDREGRPYKDDGSVYGEKGVVDAQSGLLLLLMTSWTGLM